MGARAYQHNAHFEAQHWLTQLAMFAFMSLLPDDVATKIIQYTTTATMSAAIPAGT